MCVCVCVFVKSPFLVPSLLSLLRLSLVRILFLFFFLGLITVETIFGHVREEIDAQVPVSLTRPPRRSKGPKR